MKGLLTIVLAAGAMALVSGCAVAGPGVVTGGVYSGYTLGASGTSTGPKKGEACASSILGIVALGDGSIAAAAKEGGITTVTSVDHKVFSVLGIYGTACTEVTGQ